MGGISRVWGIFCVYLRRWWSHFRLLPAIFILLALFGIVVTAIAPYMRTPGRSWSSWNSWRSSFGEGGIVLFCVLFLRYEEKFRKWYKSRGATHIWKVRMSTLEKIIDKLAHLDPPKKSAVIQHLREDILKCVVSGISETLDLPIDTLCANLLVLPESQPKSMRVVARSDDRRPIPVEYPAVDGLLPWRAIKNARMEVEDNYQEREGIGAREYKSIIAIPVTKDGCAYGSLSIDCTMSYAFNGRKEKIYYQVRPYTSLLALTFGSSSPYYECFIKPTHFR